MLRYEVTAQIDQATSVQEVAKIFEGLQQLHASHVINLTLKAHPGTESHPRIVRLTSTRDHKVREISLDLADQRDLFQTADLEQCDAYFKRSYWPEQLAALPERFRAKVLPFGLNNPVVSRSTAVRMLGARVSAGCGLAQVAQDMRQLLATPAPSAFECSPQAPAVSAVLFQTRVWPTDDPAVIAMNEERAALVAALRRAFKSRFWGGLVPNATARTYYPALLTPHPFSMRAYPRVVRRPLVAVCSRGLHESVAFKLAEYLAASRCIVSHEPGSLLPEPLVARSNYLPFRSTDDCIARCEQLLSDPLRAEEMRRQNWAYYCSGVEPSAQMLRVLEIAFSRAA
jgi:hypothetical protein